MTTSAFGWLHSISSLARHDLLSQSIARTLTDGTVLYRQGDRTTEIYQIISGEIRKVVLTEHGQETLLYIYGPGDFVADSSAIDRAPFPVTIATRGPTKLRVWSVADFNAVRARHSEIDAALALQMSQRLRGMVMLVQELVTMPVGARIASRIATLAELGGQASDSGPLGLSQADLSSMVGTTRQTVNSIINDLKNLGLIDMHYGKIIVRDLVGLRKYASNAQRKP